MASFLDTPELTLYVSLYSTDFYRFRGNSAIAGSSPCFSQKLFCAFAKPESAKGSLGQFFKFFATNNKPETQKAQKVSPFTFFGTLRLFNIYKQLGFFNKLRFLSLRYSADFRRSRRIEKERGKPFTIRLG